MSPLVLLVAATDAAVTDAAVADAAVTGAAATAAAWGRGALAEEAARLQGDAKELLGLWRRPRRCRGRMLAEPARARAAGAPAEASLHAAPTARLRRLVVSHPPPPPPPHSKALPRRRGADAAAPAPPPRRCRTA